MALWFSAMYGRRIAGAQTQKEKEMIKHLLLIILLIAGFQAQAQKESNPEPLEIEKRLDVGGKTGAEVMSCLSELFLLPGKMDTEGEISEHITVFGEWAYN